MFDIPTECVIVCRHCVLHSVLSEMLNPFGNYAFGGLLMRAQLTDSYFSETRSPPVNCSNSPICAPILWHIIKAFSFFSFFLMWINISCFVWNSLMGLKLTFYELTGFFFLLFICLCLPRSKRTACRYWEAENSVWGKSYTSQKAQNVLAVSVGGTTGCHADYSWSGSHSFTRPFFL